MLVYGVGSYACFLAAFLYSIGFVDNLALPVTIDRGTPAPMAEAIVVDVLLLAVFALQHSVMARQGFKRWWTSLVPKPIERSTYVLAASAALGLLLWQWRAIPEPTVWRIHDGLVAAALKVVFWSGWAIVLVSTFLINHFELFGLRQVWARMRGKDLPGPEFRTPLFYRYVRHPLYLGFLLAFWATPTMTAGHLLFSLATTGYVLVGIWFEERDLVDHFGRRYLRYREAVSMLLPRPPKSQLGDVAPWDTDRV
jgi:protein-S-isoprenylcysteine O-methyltransferase Ste14